MNIKSNFNKEQIAADINALFNTKTKAQLIERDALMLQANYLSEIERLTKEKGINRKEIAILINTSPSYLTQVFRGDKPLNFVTLAKIKRALGLRFDIRGSFSSEKKTENSIEENSTNNVVFMYPKKHIVFKPIESSLPHQFSETNVILNEA